MANRDFLITTPFTKAEKEVLLHAYRIRKRDNPNLTLGQFRHNVMIHTCSDIIVKDVRRAESQVE